MDCGDKLPLPPSASLAELEKKLSEIDE